MEINLMVMENLIEEKNVKAILVVSGPKYSVIRYLSGNLCPEYLFFFCLM